MSLGKAGLGKHLVAVQVPGLDVASHVIIGSPKTPCSLPLPAPSAIDCIPGLWQCWPASCIRSYRIYLPLRRSRITTYVKLIDHEHIGILWFTIFGSSDLREHLGSFARMNTS